MLLRRCLVCVCVCDSALVQVEKGTQGIDGRVVNPKGKGEHATG